MPASSQSALPPPFRSFPSFLFPRGAWLIVIITWLAVQPLPALAQRTGGSFGGGNFTSEEENPRTFRRRSVREEDSHSERTERKVIVFGTPSSFSAEKQQKDSPSLSLGSFCCILSVLVVFIIVVVIASGQQGARRGGGISIGPHAMHVSALSLALDWRARKPIQEQLEQIAQRADVVSSHGLTQALSEVVLALRRYEMSWLYVGYRNEGNHPPKEAEQVFRRLVQDFRARYQHEVIRGKGRVAGPEIRPHASEGEGVVVVTLVLATRRILRG
ncbi:MAG: DUF1517 domain-containing protein, partial [Sandaracinaceae bacterium]|nr:DUF1517 domain-containing protein [Sandaracinaceae bacterium]